MRLHANMADRAHGTMRMGTAEVKECILDQLQRQGWWVACREQGGLNTPQTKLMPKPIYANGHLQSILLVTSFSSQQPCLSNNLWLSEDLVHPCPS